MANASTHPRVSLDALVPLALACAVAGCALPLSGLHGRDAAPPDAARTDAGMGDAGLRDAGGRDAGWRDAGPDDAGPDDAGAVDGGPPDAGNSDGGPPDAGALEWRVVETLTIDCDEGGEVASATVLSSAGSWRVRAVGTCEISSGRQADAEYFDFNVGSARNRSGSLDLGIAIDDARSARDLAPYWGSYQASHVYELPWTGADAPLSARYVDAFYGDNSGSLTLELLSLR